MSRDLHLGSELDTACALCHRPFSLFFRRHHCRRCQVPACDDCSRTKRMLPNLKSTEPVRWCDKCVSLVDKHGHAAPKDLLRLEMAAVPSPELMYLRFIRRAVAVDSYVQADGTEFFRVKLHWKLDNEDVLQKYKVVVPINAEARTWGCEPENSPENSPATSNYVLTHVILRRYSDFVDLDRKLRQLVDHYSLPCQLPPKHRGLFVSKGSSEANAFLASRMSGLEEYSRFILEGHDILIKPISYMKEKSMSPAFVEASILVRAFFFSKEWNINQVENVTTEILHFDDTERWVRYLIEQGQVDSFLGTISEREQAREQRLREADVRRKARLQRSKFLQLFVSSSNERSEHHHDRETRNKSRTEREHQRLTDQRGTKLLFNVVDRNSDDAEFGQDDWQQKDEENDFNARCNELTTNHRNYEVNVCRRQEQLQLWNSQEQHPVPSREIGWILRTHSVKISLAECTHEGVPACQVRLSKLWFNLDAAMTSEKISLNQEKSNVDAALVLLNEEKDILSQSDQLQNIETARFVKEHTLINAERELRKQERLARKNKEKNILTDLQLREKISRQRQTCIDVRSLAQQARFVRSGKREEAQRQRQEIFDDRIGTLIKLCHDEEQATMGRINFEQRRLNAQQTQTVVLDFDRTKENEGRTKCDQLREELRVYFEKTQPQHINEQKQCQQDESILQEEFTASKVSKKGIDKGNPRTEHENVEKEKNEIVNVSMAHLHLEESISNRKSTILFSGASVVVAGLNSENGRLLNGKHGILGAMNKEKSRWSVAIDVNGHVEEKHIKPENLKELQSQLNDGIKMDDYWFSFDVAQTSTRDETFEVSIFERRAGIDAILLTQKEQVTNEVDRLNVHDERNNAGEYFFLLFLFFPPSLCFVVQ